MIKTKSLFSLLFTLCLFLGLIPFAQSQPNSGHIINLNVDNGMEGLNVENILVDKQKKLWVKTEKGINLYEDEKISFYRYGKKETQFHCRNKLAFFLEKEAQICLFYENEDSFYDLWDRRDTIFKIVQIPKPNINKAYKFEHWIKDKHNKVWAYYTLKNQHLLASIEDGSIIRFTAENKIKKLIPSINGFWIMTHKNQVLALDKTGKLTLIPLVGSLSNNKKFVDQILYVFYEDHSGRLWVSFKNKKGLFYKNPNGHYLTKHENANDDFTFTNLWEDNTGKLLFGCSNSQKYVKKYFILEPHNNQLKSWDYLSTVDKIPTDFIATDFYKKVYIGTYRGVKVLYFCKDFIQNVLCDPTVSAGEYGATITSICTINDSTILLLEEKKSWYILDSRTNIIKDTMSPDIDVLYHIKFATFDKTNQKLWVYIHTGEKHTSGLISFDFLHKTTKIHKIDLKISAIHADANGELLIAGYDSLQKVILSYKAPYSKTNLLLSIIDSTNRENRIRSIFVDSDKDKFWFVKDNEGLYSFDRNDNTITLTELREEITYNHINQMDNGILMISTMVGLFLVSQEGHVLKQLDKSTGMGNTSVCYATESKNGRIWMSTFSGIFSYNSDEINGNISSVDGLCSSEFNQRSGMIHSNGNIYFGSANGITIINPSVYDNYRRDINVEYIKLQDDFQDTILYNVTNNLVLHQDQNLNLNLKLLNSNWSIDDDFNYVYRILPQQNWKINKDNTLKITHLSTGKHQLEIKGLSRMGIASSNTIAIPILVYEKFFEKILFLFLIWTFSLMSILFFILKYLENKKIKKREYEFDISRKMASHELEAIRSQLNPHFVFNALGAIQHYMGKKNTDEAQLYLADFSILMRLFLESSKVKFVTLENELRMISLYIRLEKLRFDNHFTEKITVADNIIPSQCMIPSLLLQPFVENAINHGLAHKDTLGILKISVTKTNPDQLLIIIEDNGIGRLKSKEMYDKSLHKHKSRGMELVNNRIELLSKTQDCQVNVIYEDLFDTFNQSMGLRVKILISLVDYY